MDQIQWLLDQGYAVTFIRRPAAGQVECYIISVAALPRARVGRHNYARTIEGALQHAVDCVKNKDIWPANVK